MMNSLPSWSGIISWQKGWKQILLQTVQKQSGSSGKKNMLPCFWIYADLGRRLYRGEIHEHATSPNHPYAEWIATYDSPEFAADNETAIGFVTRAAARATPETRDRMWRAFYAGSVWEREFFGQTAAG